MSSTYRVHGTRFLRKYTAEDRSSIYTYMSDVRTIAKTLCKVPWERVVRDIAATTTVHTEEGLDWNVEERERFDAAEWCGEHADGFHRAFAQAACYVFEIPDSAVGVSSIEGLGVQVTSDPYNPYGARISAMMSDTLDIPTDCATVREGEVFRPPDEEGMGAAPRLFKKNPDGSQTWYANTERVTLTPAEPLVAKKYLFVFCCLENYNRARDGWIEGSSYIDNDVEVTLSAACEDLVSGELNDLSLAYSYNEFNVVRGEALPEPVGELTGIQVVEACLDGSEFTRNGSDAAPRLRDVTAEQSCVGLRTVYGKLCEGQTTLLGTAEYGISERLGASFSLSVEDPSVVGGAYRWTTRSMPDGSWTAIARGGGVIVAVRGDDSGIWYSEDEGQTWVQTNETSGTWAAVAYGAGEFVACGSSGVMYSRNGGREWLLGDADPGGWSAVAYGDGVFVAGISGGETSIWRSDDGGRTWSQSYEGSTGAWTAAAYGNGTFAICDRLMGHVHCSEDGGKTWFEGGSLPQAGLFLRTIAYGDGVFVLGGDDMGVFRSTDGCRSWEQTSMAAGTWKAIAAGVGLFVAAGDDGVWFSRDGGIEWVQSRLTSDTWMSLAFGDGSFAVCGEGDAGPELSTPVDIRSPWTYSTVVSGTWNALAHGDGLFVAGSGDDDGIWVSGDKGESWRQSGTVSGTWSAFAYGDGVFLAGSGDDGGLWYSEDGGLTWTQSDMSTGAWAAIAFGDGTFVAGGGEDDSIWCSSDGGKTWIQVAGTSSGGWCSLAYGGGVFVAGSSHGLWFSEDGGMNWTQSGVTSGTWPGLAFGDGVFVAGSRHQGDVGSVRYSSDGGKTWTRSSGLDYFTFDTISYGGGVFVAGDETSSKKAYSEDGGKSWRESDTNAQKVKSLAYGSGVFVAGSSSYADSADRGIRLTRDPRERASVPRVWRITTSALLVRFAVPADFPVRGIRLDWPHWKGFSASSGGRFNVWFKHGEFSDEFEEQTLRNHLVYDARESEVDGFMLAGTIDARDQSRTATVWLSEQVTGGVATVMLSAYLSADRVNPRLELPDRVGVAPALSVDLDRKKVSGMEAGWRPDITLIG